MMATYSPQWHEWIMHQCYRCRESRAIYLPKPGQDLTDVLHKNSYTYDYTTHTMGSAKEVLPPSVRRNEAVVGLPSSSIALMPRLNVSPAYGATCIRHYLRQGTVNICSMYTYIASHYLQIIGFSLDIPQGIILVRTMSSVQIVITSKILHNHLNDVLSLIYIIPVIDKIPSVCK